MTKFFYLHGFNSGFDPEQPKVRSFATLGEVIGRTTNYLDPRDVGKLGYQISKALESDDELILVGTSLGGYMAQYFAAKHSLRCIILNPAMNPMESLKRAVGNNKNYQTGDEYVVTEQQVFALCNYLTAPSGNNGMLVILAQDDEILDYRVAELAFKDIAKVVLTDGGHRLNDVNKVTDEIRHFINSVPVNAPPNDLSN